MCSPVSLIKPMQHHEMSWTPWGWGWTQESGCLALIGLWILSGIVWTALFSCCSVHHSLTTHSNDAVYPCRPCGYHTTEPKDISSLNLSQIVLYICIGITLKPDILLVQPSCHPSNEPPKQLTTSFIRFLSSACGIAIKHIIWEEDKFLQLQKDLKAFELLFWQHRHQYEFSAYIYDYFLALSWW